MALWCPWKAKCLSERMISAVSRPSLSTASFEPYGYGDDDDGDDDNDDDDDD